MPPVTEHLMTKKNSISCSVMIIIISILRSHWIFLRVVQIWSRKWAVGFWLWPFGRLQARSVPEVLALCSFSQTSRRPIIVDLFFFFWFRSLSLSHVDFSFFFFQKPWHSRRSSHGLLKTFLFPPTSFFHCLSVFPSCLECHRGTRSNQEPEENFILSQIQSSRRGHGESVGKITWTRDWRTGKKKRARSAISVFWKKLVFNPRCSL